MTPSPTPHSSALAFAVSAAALPLRPHFFPPLPSRRPPRLPRSPAPATPRKRARLRPAVSASASAAAADSHPDVPDHDVPDHDVPHHVRRLDELAARLRVEQPPTPHLDVSDDVRRHLYADFPELAEMDARADRAMAEGDYDPTDPHALTWLWRRNESERRKAQTRFWWRCSVAVAVVGGGGSVAMRRALRSVGVRGVMAAFLAAETMANVVLLGVMPVVLGLWAVWGRWQQPDADGVRRALIMCSLTSAVLLPVAAVASVGQGAIAVVGGVIVRGGMAAALWYWTDLRKEVALKSVPLARVFRLWRACMTWAVFVGGVSLRVAGLASNVAVGDLLVLGSRAVREKMGKTFPVALSLCNDPRGVFFGACLLLAVSFMYAVYLAVFVMDLGKVRQHRECMSVLTGRLVHAGIYLPNQPDSIRAERLSAPEGVKSFLPSSAMLLRRRDHWLSVESSMLATDVVMPIVMFLDNESVKMEEEGIKQWMKPLDELVPITADLSEEKRSMDALLSWAEPMDERDADLTFAEYFETLDDDEYRYDAESGDWVFGNDDIAKDLEEGKERVLDAGGEYGRVKDAGGASGKAVDPTGEVRLAKEAETGAAGNVQQIAEKLLNAASETELSTADMEHLLANMGDVDFTKLSVPPGRKLMSADEILRNLHRNDDDSDEPATIYV